MRWEMFGVHLSLDLELQFQHESYTISERVLSTLIVARSQPLQAYKNSIIWCNV